ncbi:hypothetical protein CI238_06197 [Colletotrichum incanum]|uniref:Uncharacterized protein n=1 Tax=Colletotrichum incanum TaxID=1573173 RepID=A0A161Y8Q3_COLIC|nr:hypothetical protein CI238_06197 [Colletotrichum incanum]
MSNKTGSNGSLGNSSNPRPGQSPFPPSNALVRQTMQSSQQNQPQQSQPYTSSYSNNFNRDTARYSTGRTEESSRYSQESIEPPNPSRSPPLRRQQRETETRKNWEESIYGMYGDIKTPREPPPQPRPEQQRRRYQQPEEDEGNDSVNEEVPRRPDPQPEPQRPRYSRPRQSSRPERPEQGRQAPRQDQQRNERQEEQNGDGNYRRVHVNIDIGGDGGRSWSWSTDGRGESNVNFGTPFMDTGFPFSGRNNNGGRLPVNLPFGGGLPINLPFGL